MLTHFVYHKIAKFLVFVVGHIDNFIQLLGINAYELN